MATAIRGEFPPNVINNEGESLMSLSLDNLFIPLLCLNYAETISVGVKKEIIYRLPSFILGSRRSRVKSLKSFIEGFSMWWWSDEWRISLRPDMEGICIAPGALGKFSEDTITPLIVLCVKRKELFSLNRRDLKDDQLVLVIDRSILNQDGGNTYTAWRNFKRICLPSFESSIDIIYTNNLKSICFYNPTPIVLPGSDTLEGIQGQSAEITMRVLSTLHRVESITSEEGDEEEEEAYVDSEEFENLEGEDEDGF